MIKVGIPASAITPQWAPPSLKPKSTLGCSRSFF
jgi:hypothetical protein